MRYIALVALGLMAGVAVGQTPSTTTTSAPATTAATRPRFTLGRETTRITGPLLADGRPDYVRAVDEEMGKGVTTENNVCVVLLEVLGTGEQVLSPRVRAETLKRMGIPDRNDAPKFQTFEEFLKEAGLSEAERSAQEEQRSQARAKPWTEKEHPEVAKWLGRNADALARVAKGVEREHYYWPRIALEERAPMISVALPALGREREVANAWVARAMLRLASGQVKECQADLLAAHRLGRLATHGATLIEKLVGAVIETLAAKGDAVMASHLSAAEAKAYLGYLGKLPAMPQTVELVDIHERYCMLDSALAVALFGPNELRTISEVSAGEAPAQRPGAMWRGTIDWDAVLMRLNGYFDRMTAGVKLPTFAGRKEAAAAFDEEIRRVRVNLDPNAMEKLEKGLASLKPAERTKLIGDLLVALLFPSLGRAGELGDEAQEYADLGMVAVALAAYRGDKGNYPEKLEELRPAYLKEIPKDRFSDAAALNYFKKDAGYVLYSVGPNMVDDQGIAGKTVKEGDMVVRVKK